MVDKIEIPNLENERLLKFLIMEKVDMTNMDEINLSGIGVSNESLAFMSGDKARVFLTRASVDSDKTVVEFSGEQILNCLRVLGKSAVIKIRTDKEFPAMVVDEDKQNVIVLAPLAKS
jgi:hypothetical protein